MKTPSSAWSQPGLLSHTDEAHPPAVATRVLSFTHLWADANGVSHFRDEKLSFEAATPENPTAGDGEVRRFELGSIVLMEDLTDKEHITRAVDDVDHIALTIPGPAAN
jgi:hypothetical protein